MMKTNLKWRLGKLPTVAELGQLIKDKVITQEDVKNILFTTEEIDERDKKSLEDEIKFLRSLVESLSKDRKTIIETIKIVEKPYKTYPWYQPYYDWYNNMPLDNNIVYCGSSGTTNLYGTVGTSSTTLTGNASLNNVMGTQAANLVTTGLSQLQPSAFSSIKTF